MIDVTLYIKIKMADKTMIFQVGTSTRIDKKLK